MILTLLAVGIVLFCIGMGLWKGLVWQLTGIFSFVSGFSVAIPASGPLAPIFGASQPTNRFIAMAVIFIIVTVAVYVVGFRLRKLIKKVKLKEWDRHLGSIVGGIRGWLTVVTLVFFAVTISKRARAEVLDTPVGRGAAATIDVVRPIWPDEVHQILHPYVHGLQEHEDEKEHEHP